MRIVSRRQAVSFMLSSLAIGASALLQVAVLMWFRQAGYLR